jgi:Tfp pilus assembly protein PilN
LDFLLKCKDKQKSELQQLRGESGTPQNIVYQNLYKIADEIKLSLQFYNTTYEKPVEKIFLCGGGALLPGINDFLAIDLDLPVATLNVMQYFDVNEHILKSDDQPEIAPLLATAIGLCKNYHRPALNLWIDLRKKVDTSDSQKTRKIYAGVAACMIFFLMLIVIRYALNHQSNKLQVSIEKNQNLIGELKTKISDLEHYNALKDDIDSQIRQIKSLKIRQPRWSLVLKEISKTIPQDIWLTQFSGTYQSVETNSGEEFEEPSDSENELKEKIQYSQMLFLGQTSQPNQIQEFVNNMEKNTNFNYINFNKITSRQTEKKDITHFQIDGRMEISGN